jgi:uncharacterized protein YbjT (DUF2867 family)
MRIFLTGASGYVGHVVAKTLIHEGHEVVALHRNGSERPLADGNLTRVVGDITDPDSLKGKIDGCDAVVHLVGIIRESPKKGITMQRIHADGTKHVIEEAKRAGIRRFLHMSALGAREQAISAYHRSKWQGEEYVRQAGFDYTIFQPSVIFGKGGPGPNFLQQLADLIRKAPIVPVIGDGGFRLQPVSLQNVAQGFSQALKRPQTIGNVYEVCGPEPLTYRQILEYIADYLGKRLRTMTVPVSLMTRLVPLLQHLPGFPLTEDQLQMLLEENICRTDWRKFYRDLQIEPEAFHVAL